MGRCPSHENRTPSLLVSPTRNLWHGLGDCNPGGSTLGFRDGQVRRNKIRPQYHGVGRGGVPGVCQVAMVPAKGFAVGPTVWPVGGLIVGRYLGGGTP
jgi:hypothetical protein